VGRRRSFSGTSFAGIYFLVQALAIPAWWLCLVLAPATRTHFVPPGASEADLMAFMAADLLLAAPVSFAAGVAFLRGSSWSQPLCWLAAGATLYAFLYCLGWSVLRGGAWLGVVLMAPAGALSTAAALDASAGTVTIFRRASPTGASKHVIATLAQMAVFWTFFLLVVPLAIERLESRLGVPGFSFAGQSWMAAAIFVGFSTLGLASGVTMASRGIGTPLPFAATNRLVITGPYAYLRNPMVVAGLGQGGAVGVWLGSWPVVAYAILGGVMWQVLAKPAEEQDLLQHFGQEYIDYRAQVRCWVPRLRPFERPAALQRSSRSPAP
jgi:protein-S-isoprenylcysteine O-methyltransferase Ste14